MEAAVFPRQKIPKSEKNSQWYRNNTEHLLDQASYYSGDRAEMIELYKAARGEVDRDAYKYVLNPFNSPSENLTQFPARLRNYDIIIPIISLYLGEKADRPFNHRVIVANPDVTNKNEDRQKQEFLGVMSQDFVNGLNKMGVPTGIPSQPIPAYDQVQKKYNVQDITDERAVYGQQALDYIKHRLSLKDKYMEGMYDWLAVGRVYTYKDVFKNDLLHELVPPLEIWNGPTRTGFVEDAAWAIRKTRYNLNDVIDRFHEEFENGVYDGQGKKFDPIIYLENKYNNNITGSTSITPESYTSLDRERDDHLQGENRLFMDNKGLIEVCHVVWKGFTQVGILKYTDELGQIQEMEVDESYTLNLEQGDIEVKKYWMSIIHEQYKIDDEIYVYGRELQVQRNELSNTSIVKLPYNGRSGYTERDKINSVVKQILPYAALVNIYHWRLEMIIAKNKEKIMTLPLGLIPDGEGWSEDKVFHIMEAMNLLVIDETKPNAIAALNALKALDMSLGKYISEMISLIRDIKAEAWDAIGMNRQRYGDTQASDGKATTEQAIIRSSTISRELNRRFEKFEETDLQGLIEYSKVAWIDGKKGSYINGEGKEAFLNIDGMKWLDTDLGVFVVDSQEEYGKLKMAKDYAFGYAQKANVPGSTVMEVIDANNMSQLKKLVAKSEQIVQEYTAQVAKNEQEHEQALKEAELQKEKMTGDYKLQAENIKGEFAIKVALINGNESSESPTNEGGEFDVAHENYINKIRNDISNKQKEGMKYADRIGSDRLKEAKMQLDREKMANDLKIAKTNKN